MHNLLLFAMILVRPSQRSIAPTVERFDFKYVVASGGSAGSIKVIANPSDPSDPCESTSTDLSGVIEVQSTGGWGDFQETEV